MINGSTFTCNEYIIVLEIVFVIVITYAEADGTSDVYAEMPVLTTESPLPMEGTVMSSDERQPITAKVEAAEQSAIMTESPLTAHESARTTENSANGGGVGAAEQSPMNEDESRDIPEESSVTEGSQLSEEKSVTEGSQLTEGSFGTEDSQITEGSSLLEANQVPEDNCVNKSSCHITEDTCIVQGSQFSSTGSTIAAEHTSNPMSINELDCAVDHLYAAITSDAPEQTDRSTEQHPTGIY